MIKSEKGLYLWIFLKTDPFLLLASMPQRTIPKGWTEEGCSDLLLVVYETGD